MFSAVLGIERLISMLFIVRDMVLTPKVNITKKEWLVLTQNKAKPTSCHVLTSCSISSAV